MNINVKGLRILDYNNNIMTDNIEEWKVIDDYERYEVSSFGRVRKSGYILSPIDVLNTQKDTIPLIYIKTVNHIQHQSIN